MTRRFTPILLAGLAVLAACDGPREDAGENADAAANLVSSEDSIQSGPAETAGEMQDEANASAAEAREARADALEDAADEQRHAADQKADALQQQAERTRGQ